jgi:hypothetical protein
VVIVAETAFDLIYDGEALRTHEMNVRDLAPALIAMADVVQEMNRVLHPTNPDVSVNVAATDGGSFLVQLKFLLDEAEGLLLSSRVLAAESLGAIVSGVIGLTAWLKKSRTAREIGQRPADAPGDVVISFDDNTSITIPRETLAVRDNLVVRRAFAEVVRPLTRDGVDTLRFRNDKIVIGEITRDEAETFMAPPGQEMRGGRELLSTYEREGFLSIVSLTFKRHLKWRLSDGRNTFYALILDQAFLDRVEAGEPFANRDLLRCRIRETQWRDLMDGALRAEVEVLRVLEHRPAAVFQQESLLFAVQQAPTEAEPLMLDSGEEQTDAPDA